MFHYRLITFLLSITLTVPTFAFPATESYAALAKRCQTNSESTPSGTQCWSTGCGILDECSGITGPGSNSGGTASIVQSNDVAGDGAGSNIVNNNGGGGGSDVIANNNGGGGVTNNNGGGGFTSNNNGPGNHDNNNGVAGPNTHNNNNNGAGTVTNNNGR